MAATTLIPITGLPDGANITRLNCRYYDNEATLDYRIICTLFDRSEVSVIANSVMAEIDVVTSGASNSIRTTTDISITNSLVDTDTKYYFARITIDPTAAFPGGVDRFRQYGTDIEYNVPGPRYIFYNIWIIVV